MPGHLLLHPPTALEYFASLVEEEAGLPLLEAAIALAQDEFTDLDTQSVLAEIDALAARLKARIPADAVALQRLRWLNRYFFQELGFAGNVNDYYHPHNSYIHRVLQTRRGIPITLALIYIELAGELGLAASGVSFPGHFLVKLRMPQGEVVIDPFTGQSLSRDALASLLAPHRPVDDLVEPGSVPLSPFLQTAGAREIIGRMLRNLKEIHRSAEDWTRLLAVMHRLIILLPDAWIERRDRGLVYARLGMGAAALDDLTAYLAHAPDAADRNAIAARVAELGQGRSPHLH